MSAIVIEPIDSRPFYTPKSLAKRLALSERKVRAMLADCVIPSVMIEGSRRIDPADVDSYLADLRKKENG